MPGEKQTIPVVVLDVDGTCMEVVLDDAGSRDSRGNKREFYNHPLFRYLKYYPAQLAFLTKMNASDAKLTGALRSQLFAEMKGAGVDLSFRVDGPGSLGHPLCMLTFEALYADLIPDYKCGDVYATHIVKLEQAKQAIIEKFGDERFADGNVSILQYVQLDDLRMKVKVFDAFITYCTQDGSGPESLTLADCDAKRSEFLASIQWDQHEDELDHDTIFGTMQDGLAQSFGAGDSNMTLSAAKAALVALLRANEAQSAGAVAEVESVCPDEYRSLMQARLGLHQLMGQASYADSLQQSTRRQEKPAVLKALDGQLRKQGVRSNMRYLFVDDRKYERDTVAASQLTDDSSVTSCPPPYCGFPHDGGDFKSEKRQSCSQAEFLYHMTEQIAACYPDNDYHSRYMLWRIAFLLSDDPDYAPKGGKSLKDRYKESRVAHLAHPGQKSEDAVLLTKWKMAENDLAPLKDGFGFGGWILAAGLYAMGALGAVTYAPTAGVTAFLAPAAALGVPAVAAVGIVLAPATLVFLVLTALMRKYNRPEDHKLNKILNAGRLGCFLMPFVFGALVAASLPVTWPALLGLTVLVPLFVMGARALSQRIFSRSSPSPASVTTTKGNADPPIESGGGGPDARLTEVVETPKPAHPAVSPSAPVSEDPAAGDDRRPPPGSSGPTGEA